MNPYYYCTHFALVHNRGGIVFLLVLASTCKFCNIPIPDVVLRIGIIGGHTQLSGCLATSLYAFCQNRECWKSTTHWSPASCCREHLWTEEIVGGYMATATMAALQCIVASVC